MVDIYLVVDASSARHGRDLKNVAAYVKLYVSSDTTGNSFFSNESSSLECRHELLTGHLDIYLMVLDYNSVVIDIVTLNES